MDYDALNKELSHKKKTVSDLISYLSTRASDSIPNYNIFLGAGASVSSEIRSGGELVNLWRKELYEELSGEKFTDVAKAKAFLKTEHGSWYNDLNEYSCLFEKKFDLPSQRRRFVEKEVDKKFPSIGYAYLTSLVGQDDNRFFDTIFTTNFDDLINEAFYHFCKNRPIVCAQDSSVDSLTISSKRPKIIKLHGDYLFDDIKSAVRETESLENNMRNKFIEFSKEYGLIVVGYGGNDRSIMDVINQLLKTDSYFKNGIYWCVRENDYISSDLRKLLWKDRVYYVEIKGFDELMAEIHHKIKGKLFLKENLFNTRQEDIIKSYMIDKRGLSKSSQYIKNDVENLEKHKENVEISNMITELRNLDDDNSHISQSEFKNILEVEKLIERKEYSLARTLAKEALDNTGYSQNIRSNFLKKLIYICKKSGAKQDADIYANSLISMDEYDYRSYIIKAKVFDKPEEKALYLNEIVTDGRFKNIPKFTCYVIEVFLKCISRNPKQTLFTLEYVEELIDKCLLVDPSLDNGAWLLKMDLIEVKGNFYKDCKDEKYSKINRKSHIKNLISKAQITNDSHLNFLKMLCHSENGDTVVDFLLHKSKIKSVFISSSIGKKLNILNMFCDQLRMIDSYIDKDFSYVDTLKDFFNDKDYSAFTEKSKLSSYSILHATYIYNVTNDMNLYRDELVRASECPDSIDNHFTLFNNMLRLLNDFDLAQSYLDKIKDKISETNLYLMKSDLALESNDIEKSISLIEKAHEFDYSLSRYAVSKSFIQLKAKRYQDVINFVDSIYEKIIQSEDKDILLINKECAKKMSSGELDKVLIRNVINRNPKPNTHIILACYCLLDQDKDAVRVLTQCLKNNREDYLMFKWWPVIEPKYFEQYEKSLELKQVS